MSVPDELVTAAAEELCQAWTPKFGEQVESVYASTANPRRVGLFVRAGHTPHGRMNAGPWWELTDGKGDFWRARPENCRRPEAT